MYTQVINYNEKFKSYINNPLYEISSVSIMVYYNSDKASISYSGNLSVLEEDTGEYTKKRCGGFFYLPKEYVADITSKKFVEFLKQDGGSNEDQ